MRGLIASTVLAGHAIGIGTWINWIDTAQRQQVVFPKYTPTYAVIIPGTVARESIPLPLTLAPVSRPDTTIARVSFEDPDDGLAGVTASVSAPRLRTLQSADVMAFARRAGLTPGTTITVILAIEVLADGSTGQVSVLVGSGNALADEAAAEYVRALRWTPGSLHQQATTMRIQFPVTLSVPPTRE